MVSFIYSIHYLISVLSDNELHLFRRLLLSLLDDPLDASREETIHLVTPFVWDESRQRSHDEWESNWTHKSTIYI